MFRTSLARGIAAVKPSYSIPRRVTCQTILGRGFGIRRMATGGTGHLNRLATAKSPYLRQHATNPVDWYPFEKTALDKARAENKVLRHNPTTMAHEKGYILINRI